MTNGRQQHERSGRSRLLAGLVLLTASAAIGLSATTAAASAIDDGSGCATQVDTLAMSSGAPVVVEPVVVEPVVEPVVVESVVDPTGGAQCQFIDAPTAQVVAPAHRYDLALIVRLARNQVFFLGNTVMFEVVVANHGDVASGSFSVQQAIPAGMSLVSADHGGVLGAGTIQWTDMAELRSGEQRTLTTGLRLDALDIVNGHRTIAEISSDSGDDWDSTPDNNPYNDGLVETDDVSLEIVGDSDDHDITEVSAAQVRFDNQQRLAAAQVATPDAAQPPAEPQRTDSTAASQIAPIPLPAPPLAEPLSEPSEMAPAPTMPDNSRTATEAPAAPPTAITIALPATTQATTLAIPASSEQRVLPATGRSVDAMLLMAAALTAAGLALVGLRRSQMISRPSGDR